MQKNLTAQELDLIYRMSGPNERILDRTNYTNETLDTFGFISAYFIDLFYNHFYDAAHRYHRSGQANSVTEGFRYSLEAYVTGINTGTIYRDILYGLHQYFLSYGYSAMSYENCINRISREFVPKEYWELLAFEEKGQLVCSVINETTRAMVTKIQEHHLHEVIDNHDCEENVIIWQDEFVDILLLERARLDWEIKNQKIGGKNVEVSDILKKEILLICKEKDDIAKKLVMAKKEILGLKKNILELHKDVGQLTAENKELNAEIKSLRSVAATQSSPISSQASTHDGYSTSFMNDTPQRSSQLNILDDDDLLTLEDD